MVVVLPTTIARSPADSARFARCHGVVDAYSSNGFQSGDIGGNMMGSDLTIGLGELNGSGYSGAAWSHDNGDGTTTVSVFLTHSGGDMGTPTA